MPRFSDRFSPPTPKYRKHRASGQAVVTLNGRDCYLGPYGTSTSRIEYDRRIAEWLASGRNLTANGVSDLTVIELCATFWRHAKAYYVKDGCPTSMLGGIKRAIDPLRQLYGRTLVMEFGPKRLKALRHELLQAGRTNRTTINKRIGIVKQMFEWGVAEELVPPSVFQALAAVKGLRKGRTTAREPEPVMPVDDATVDATLPCLPVVVADMVRFQRLTGCRPGEVCRLRPCDVDRSSAVWSYRPTSHKCQHHDRERIVYIGPKAQALLLPYMLRPADTHCFSPAESAQKQRDARHAARKTPLKYGNRPGTNRKARPKRGPADRYSKDAYGRAIARGIDRANKQRAAAGATPLPHWHANRLRHSAGTEIRQKFGLEAAQVVLGHAKADVTQIYAERDMTLAVEVMREVG